MEGVAPTDAPGDFGGHCGVSQAVENLYMAAGTNAPTLVADGLWPPDVATEVDDAAATMDLVETVARKSSCSLCVSSFRLGFWQTAA